MVTLAAAVAVVFGAFFGYRIHRAGKTEEHARQTATDLLSGRPVYTANQAYIEQLIDQAHEEAFEDAYDFGGLTSKATYDEEVYLSTLWAKVFERASAEGRDDIAKALPIVGAPDR